jgi:hypothetical protein
MVNIKNLRPTKKTESGITLQGNGYLINDKDRTEVLDRARAELGCDKCKTPLNKSAPHISNSHRPSLRAPIEVSIECPYRFRHHKDARCLHDSQE